MEHEQIDWLVYVDTPVWDTDTTDWRRQISSELRAVWPTLTYEQKWHIARRAARIKEHASPIPPFRKRAELDEGGVTPVDRPASPVPFA